MWWADTEEVAPRKENESQPHESVASTTVQSWAGRACGVRRGGTRMCHGWKILGANQAGLGQPHTWVRPRPGPALEEARTFSQRRLPGARIAPVCRGSAPLKPSRPWGPKHGRRGTKGLSDQRSSTELSRLRVTEVATAGLCRASALGLTSAPTLQEVGGLQDTFPNALGRSSWVLGSSRGQDANWEK